MRAALCALLVAAAAPLAHAKSDFQLSPSSLDFGALALSATKTLPVTLTNPNQADPLQIVSIATDDTNGVFTVDASGCPQAQVGPAASCTVQVTFSSASAGTFNANLKVASDVSPSSPQQAPLVGRAGPPVVKVDPDTLLADAHVDTTHPIATNFTVGNAGALDLQVTAITSSDPQFQIAAPLPQTVAGGGKMTYTIAFAPTQAGAANATISVATNDPQTPTATFQVTANGVAYGESVAPTTVTFPETVVGNTCKGTATITNASTAPLWIDSATVTGAAFALPSAIAQKLTKAQLPPGDTTVEIDYTPPGPPGTDNGTLTVATDDPKQPTLTVTLTGTSRLGLAVSLATLDFGAVPRGGSATVDLTITNHTGATTDVKFVAVALDADGGASSQTAFSAVEDMPRPLTGLADGASGLLHVTFTAAADGPAQATLILSAMGSPDEEVPLTAVGFTPQVALFPELSWSGVPVGGMGVPQAMTVKNASTAPIQIDKVTVGSDQFTLDLSPLPKTLLAGASTSFNIDYAPTAAGNADAQIALFLVGQKSAAATAPVHGTTFLLDGGTSGLMQTPDRSGCHCDLSGRARPPLALFALALLALVLRRRRR